MEKIKSVLKKLAVILVAAFVLFLLVRSCIPEPQKVAGVNNFGRTFNDLQSKQMEAAEAYGIQPVADREELEKMSNRKITLLEDNKYYAVDELEYSAPYLTKNAAKCLDVIAIAFRDSLQAKHYPKCKLLVTSVLRTRDDVEKLRKKNINATQNSCHMYGTTFDISWKSFVPVRKTDIDAETMKLILSEVLRDQRDAGLCYVKYERKEGCFHITSRIPSRGRKK